ncbi:MAG: DinB family protein [bacterium]|nr:DinB family protein [bacterium]
MLVLKYPIPVKIPSPRMGPQGDRSLAELRREWDENQQWLGAYAAGLVRDGVAKAVFVHPVAGPMTVTQAVAMDQLHLDRHIRQIRRRQYLMG